MPLFELVQSIVPVFNLTMLAVLLLMSRRWTGPGLNVRVEALEEELHVVRGNLARVDRDLTAWHRGSQDANSAILRELEEIREMINGKVSLRRTVEEMGDEIQELRGAIEKIPCGRFACPPDETMPKA